MRPDPQAWLRAMIVLDSLTIAACLLSWHAYAVAPRNDFTVAGDDLGFVVAALVYSGVFLVRIATLTGASVVTWRWLRTTRRVNQTTTARAGRVAAAAFVTVELASTWYCWRATEDQLVPSSLVQILACLVSATSAFALLHRLRSNICAVPS